MKIHPALADPNAVVVFQSFPAASPAWDEFQLAARRVMAAMQIELEDEKVVLKPNATSGERFADPDTGITTHPGFIEGMIDYLKEHGARRDHIRIVEDPRNTDDDTPRHWRGTGFEAVAERTGAKLHCPSAPTSLRVYPPRALAHESLRVSRIAVAPQTALFNVPKLKTHNLAITTLCMKNLMGLVYAPDRHYCMQAWGEMPAEVRGDKRPRYEWLDRAMHRRWQDGLARRLVDTARVIRPALNMVEGIVGREGTGFQRGRNRSMGLAVAGINPVAVDAFVSYLMGFDPRDLVYLQLAMQAGLGEARVEALQVYVEREGELVPASDVSSLRVDPPFRVISGVVGEDLDPFNLAAAAISTAGDPILNFHKR